MIRLILDLLGCLSLLGSAVQVIPLPGIPVAIHPLDGGIAAVCADRSLVCIVNADHTVDVLPCDVLEPRDICLWNGELAVSDFAGESIVMGDRVIPLRGRPNGICEVLWDTSSAPALAVALFDPGIVVLVEEDGTVSTLVKLPGAKSVSSCDMDGDGDVDLFASGCRSGVIAIENRASLPVAHRIGTIGAGVKRCFAVDMDGDSLMDVAGIACAEGGAGWWRNPGGTEGNWEFHPIDESLSGPKDIWCSGDSIVIASLFSDVFVSFLRGTRLPEGFLCCCISDEGGLVLGHRLGFLVQCAPVIPAQNR